MKPIIERSTRSTSYVVGGVRLLINKTKTTDRPAHIVTFLVGDRPNSVLIDRYEATYTLKNFRKVLAKSNKNA